MKTYVLTIAKTFPAHHPNKGEQTHFATKIASGMKPYDAAYDNIKLHTIRGNYPLWEKRFQEINAGRAILSVREWTGRPYHSEQNTLFDLDHTDGIGIQPVVFFTMKDKIYGMVKERSKGVVAIKADDLARNDGLSTISFKEWFKMKPKPPKGMFAIIYFTGFRYLKNEL